MTNIQKQKLWNEDIKMLSCGNLDSILQSRGANHLKEAGIKLYKYYSLNSAFSWSNLVNDEIFLSDPASFNDPFDGNMGISDLDLFKAFLPYEIVKSNNQIDLLSAQKIVKLFSQNPDKPIRDEEKLIENLNKLPSFRDFQKEPSIDKIIDLIFNNSDFLLTFCLHATGYKIPIEEIRNSFIGKIISSLPQLLNSPSLIGEQEVVNSFLSTGKFDLSNNGTLDVLKLTSEVRTALSQWNNVKSEVLQKLHNSMGTMFGISCFSTNPYNVLMWSHYANKHTGICVEYDFSLLSEEIKALILPVIYTKRRPTFPIEQVLKLEKQNIGQFEIKKFLPILIKAQLTKSEVWGYEDEWRLLGLTPLNAKQTIRMPIITKIITGVKISDVNKRAVEKIVKEKGISVENCSMKSNEYALS